MSIYVDKEAFKIVRKSVVKLDDFSKKLLEKLGKLDGRVADLETERYFFEKKTLEKPDLTSDPFVVC